MKTRAQALWLSDDFSELLSTYDFPMSMCKSSVSTLREKAMSPCLGCRGSVIFHFSSLFNARLKFSAWNLDMFKSPLAMARGAPAVIVAKTPRRASMPKMKSGEDGEWTFQISVAKAGFPTLLAVGAILHFIATLCGCGLCSPTRMGSSIISTVVELMSKP